MSLRESTGVPMMACKKALEESGGDMEKAVEILRKQGAAKADMKSDRMTSQGAVAIFGKAIASVRCETDFVARSDDFLAFVASIAEAADKGGPDEAKKMFDAGKTDLFTKLGENMTFGDAKVVAGDVVGGYLHSNRKVGALVALTGGNEDVAKDIAMHATAMNPSVLSPDEVSAELVAKEKDIWTAQLKNEGKPDEIIAKVLIGKERKFREENALVKQVFVKDQEKTVEAYAKANGAEVKGFVRVGV